MALTPAKRRRLRAPRLGRATTPTRAAVPPAAVWAEDSLEPLPGGGLQVPNLRLQARRVIRASIAAGEFKPGEIHSVSDLTARLQVSATPIREAVLDLASEGLLQTVRNRGFRVTRLQEDDLREIFQLREMIEVPSMGDVSQLPDLEDLPELRRMVKETQAAAARGDFVGFLAADRALHLRLLGALGNRRLVQIVGRLRDQTVLGGSRSVPALVRSHATVSAAEHTELLDAIAKHDRARAERAMRTHLRRGREERLFVIRQGSQPPGDVR